MQSSWEVFLDACVKKRVPPEKFDNLVKAFQSKHSVPSGRDLVSILLNPKFAAATEDPRIPLYIRQLLHLGACDIADVLASLRLIEERSGVVDGYDQNILEIGNQPPSTEATIIQILTTEVIEGVLQNAEEVQAILRALVPMVARYPSSTALGFLISAILSSPLANTTLNESSTKSTSILIDFTKENKLMAGRLESFFWQMSFYVDCPSFSDKSAAGHYTRFLAKTV